MATASVDGSQLLLTANAADLLTQDGENFVAIAVAENGELRLVPLNLPAEVVSVARIACKGNVGSQTRVTVTRCKLKSKQRFSCAWDDLHGCLALTSVE
jgi:hypothetical protein